MSIFILMVANFGQKRVQVFACFLEKCVDAKFLRLVEKKSEIPAKCVEDRIYLLVFNNLTSPRISPEKNWNIKKNSGEMRRRWLYVLLFNDFHVFNNLTSPRISPEKIWNIKKNSGEMRRR